jgi:single-strand DNA-binding protein
MSQDINSVVLIGRLTRNSDLKYTPSGTAVTTFALAVNRRVKQGDQWIDMAGFFDVTLWGKIGESIAQYLIKGGQVAVQGELRQDRWEKDGQKHSRVYVVAETVQLLGGKKAGKTAPAAAAAARPIDDEEGFGEDDIPF